MNIDANYFRAIQNATGLSSEQDVVIRDTKNRLTSDLTHSVHYKESAKINGVAKKLIIAPGKVSYKSAISVLPDDELWDGDIVSDGNNNWLVIETKMSNPVQTVGVGWLCNHKFRFQNGASTIIEAYGVLDNGTYSKTKDDQIIALDNKYKIYLPYNDDTKKLYIDKRLATNVSYDASGAEILTCYKITAVDPVSQNFGQGAHLLVLTVESCTYDKSVDSISEVICNYIASGSTPAPSPTLLPCSITTLRSSIRTGASFTFMATFYKVDGTTVDPSVVAKWSVSPVIAGITSTPNGSSISISVANNDDLVGQTFTVSVTDAGGLYNTATCNVEVV